MMTDLVVGLGEIGKPIYDLLKERNFKVDGYDSDPSKTVINKENMYDKYDMIHICIPYHDEAQFLEALCDPKYRTMTDYLVIHSTVKEGTSDSLKAIYSPVRGVHHDMFNCLKSFTKYYAWHEDLMEFEKRFPKCIRVTDADKLERTKHVSTSMYGAFMSVQRYFQENHPYYKDFMFELNDKYGILPTYYNDKKEFGGHCIVPNLDFLNDKFINNIIGRYGGKD